MHNPGFSRLRLTLAALAVVTLLAGCQPIQPEAGTVPAPAETAAPGEEAVSEAAQGDLPVVTFTVTADGITVPDEVMSGIVEVQFANEGGPEGLPEIGRLVEGATVDQVMEALGRMETEGPGPALELVKLYGYNEMSVGSRLIYDLQPGNYVAILFPQEEGGMPLMAEFATGTASPAQAPTDVVPVQLDDFAFIMPDTVPSGPQLWQIENVGEQWHELAVVQTEGDMTIEELMQAAMESGPEDNPEDLPFQIMGIWTPMSEGNRAWGIFDLPPGEYTVVCFLPDLAGDMSPHAMHGMVRQLVVE